MKKEYKAGEGYLKIKLKENGIELQYVSIDDYYKQKYTVDDLMVLLGYESLERKKNNEQKT